VSRPRTLEAVSPDDAPGGRAGFLRDAILRSYAQILFSQSTRVGAIVLLATAVEPRLLVGGLAAVLLATAIACTLHFGKEAIRDGLFGYNALLVGLGTAALLPVGGVALAVGTVAVLAAVLATAAARSLLWQGYGLPVLTVPFLIVFYLLLGAAPLLGAGLTPLPLPDAPLDALLADPARDYLRSLGAIFFIPRADAGAIVLLALAVFSRIGVVLSALGFGVAWLFGLPLLLETTPLLSWIIGYNFILVAIALGGVWFVPGPASLGLALVGTLLSGLVSIGLLSLLGPMGIPLLILPFNLTVLLILAALRQRTVDGSPRSVDFLPGSPEQNLAYFQTRLARFGAIHSVRFRAPFLGAWCCTQGVDGAVSHRGPWRHAYDFEICDRQGRTFAREGATADDYLCYRAPVLATADGTVARAVDGVPDNAIGQPNLRQNWGNLIVLQHGPALFSMVAHLAPGSLKVREGQVVRRGDALGLCGNSGRSAVPHLHFQLQRTSRPGDATIASELHEVIEPSESGEQLHGRIVPTEGSRLRNIEPDPRHAQLLGLEYRQPLEFSVDRGGVPSREVIVPDIDLYGRLVLRSTTHSASLFYEQTDDLFTVYDTLGSRSSMLYALHAALARLPFELDRHLTWSDELPLRALIPWPLRPLLDVASILLPPTGVRMHYSVSTSADGATITGESDRRSRDGTALLATHAVLSTAHGLERIEMTTRGARTVAVREDHEDRDGHGATRAEPVAASR
jgi:urea transporter/murein DD-endopeptidase MepM/ murein hydrolase activator NlpD